MSGGKAAASAAADPIDGRLESALAFTALGVPVVVVHGKNPGALLGREWQRRATTDEGILRGWLARWPTANIGIVPTNELLPIDVDDPESLAKLEQKAPTPPTPRYLTGGAPGRERLLFAHPGEDVLARLSDTYIAPGVQVRAPRPGGGALMSVIPPSVNPDSGVPYEWRIGLDEAPLAQIPAAWLPERRERRGRKKSEWAEVVTATYTPGDRHATLMSLAGRLVPAVGTRATFELLRGWNQRHCRPPKPDEEIADVVRWTARKELGR